MFGAWIVAVTVGAGSKEQAGEASSPPAGGVGALPAKGTVTLQWVGDITLGSRYGLPPDNAAAMFAGTESLLGDADLTIGNLEGRCQPTG